MKGFLFVSGQAAIDSAIGEIITKGVKEQTAQAMENIKAILQAADYSLRDFIQSNVYLASMSLFRDFSDEYAKYFDTAFLPARQEDRTDVRCPLEISVVACKP